MSSHRTAPNQTATMPATTLPRAAQATTMHATEGKTIDLDMDPAISMAREHDTTLSDDLSFPDADLTLCRLCVGEHEFGVALEEDSDNDNNCTTRANIAHIGQMDSVSNGASQPNACSLPSVDALDDSSSTVPHPTGSSDAVRGVFDFDVSAYVHSKIRAGVALDALAADLDTFIPHIQGKMQQHVHTDLYNAFINVSSHLVGVQEELQFLHRPLSHALTTVGALRDRLREKAETVQMKFNHAVEAELERVFALTMIRVILVYDAVMNTLQRIAQQSPLLRGHLRSDITKSTDANTSSNNTYDALSLAGAQACANCMDGSLVTPADATAEYSVRPGGLSDMNSPVGGRYASRDGGQLRHILLNTSSAPNSPSSAKPNANRFGGNVAEMRSSSSSFAAVRPGEAAERMLSLSPTHTCITLRMLESVMTSVQQLDFLVNSLPSSSPERHEEEMRAAQHRRALARSAALDVLNTICTALCQRSQHILADTIAAPTASTSSMADVRAMDAVASTSQPMRLLLPSLRMTVSMYVRANAISTLCRTLRHAVVQPVLEDAVQRAMNSSNVDSDSNRSGVVAATDGGVGRVSVMQRRLQSLHDAIRDTLLPLLLTIRAHAESTRCDEDQDDAGGTPMTNGRPGSDVEAQGAKQDSHVERGKSVPRTPLCRIAQDVLWPCVMHALDGGARGCRDAYSATDNSSSSRRSYFDRRDNRIDSSGRAEGWADLRSSDVFPRSYRAAYALAALMEWSCVTREEWLSLRQSPAVTAWHNRWDTDIYTALHVSEVERAVDEALQTHKEASLHDILASSTRVTAAAAQAGNTSFALAPFDVLVTQLRTLFTPEVMLPVCLPAFIRLTVQLCVRVGEALCHLPPTEASPAAILPATSTKDSTVASGHSSIPSMSGTATNSNSAPTSSAVIAEEDEGAVDWWIMYMADVHRLDDFIQKEWAERVMRGAHAWSTMGWGAESAASLRAMLTPIQTELHRSVLTRLLTRAEECAVGEVTRISAGALQNVKSIRSAYSRTNKPLPQMASWYVVHVSDLILRFVRRTRASGVPTMVTQRAAVAAMSTVTRQFVALARDTLVAARRMEASWEKLRRRKETSTTVVTLNVAAAASAASASASSAAVVSGPCATLETASDRDKMMLQLYWDITTFLSTVAKELGAWASPSREARQQVDDLLQRAQWLLGAPIAEPPEIDDATSQ